MSATNTTVIGVGLNPGLRG